MIGRCYRPKDISYPNYGGRGIQVCDEWRKPGPFLEWSASNGYSEGLMLDRVDNDKGYGPDNCKWSTRDEQNNNRRNCVYVMLDGERMTAAQAERKLGLGRSVLRWRLKQGWSGDRLYER